ncbi:glycosyltransferase [Desertivirga xinjiangensis]|uniref:glycosyltransferase n=1 Tax=Desertivirga xinjiangensis TaxID=539206 RepID=UPI00210A1BD0|nr:glycosyltransferase [Pedobacter xinjiangensis]
MIEVSVIVCSHNPKIEIFSRTIDHLKNQDLSTDRWELILIDNLSDSPLDNHTNLSWHRNSKIVVEQTLGLSFARLRGVKEAKADLIIFVDDDNLLNYDYISHALNFHKKYPYVGCFGGKAIPEFATPPPAWFFKTGISLGCRDLGDTLQISNYKANNFKISEYPAFAPIGTGMVITKPAFLAYVAEAEIDMTRLNLGRRGKALTSGEDNDIVLTVTKKGYEIAYVPALIILHIIPSSRYSKSYLQRMAFESNRSWVKVLFIHNILPWKPISSTTLPLRRAKAFWHLRAWSSSLNYTRWKAACGKLTGLSELNKL